MVQRFRATGSAAPRKMGGYRPRVLIGEHRAWLLRRIASGSDMTLRGLVAELAEQGVKVSYRTVWNFVHREKISYKKKRSSRRAKSPRRSPPSRALETLSGQDRSQASGLHRRNLGQDQYGAAPGLVRARQAPRRARSLRPLEDVNFCGRAALRLDRSAMRL